MELDARVGASPPVDGGTWYGNEFEDDDESVGGLDGMAHPEEYREEEPDDPMDDDDEESDTPAKSTVPQARHMFTIDSTLRIIEWTGDAAVELNMDATRILGKMPQPHRELSRLAEIFFNETCRAYKVECEPCETIVSLDMRFTDGSCEPVKLLAYTAWATAHDFTNHLGQRKTPVLKFRLYEGAKTPRDDVPATEHWKHNLSTKPLTIVANNDAFAALSPDALDQKLDGFKDKPFAVLSAEGRIVEWSECAIHLTGIVPATDHGTSIAQLTKQRSGRDTAARITDRLLKDAVTNKKVSTTLCLQGAIAVRVDVTPALERYGDPVASPCIILRLTDQGAVVAREKLRHAAIPRANAIATICGVGKKSGANARATRRVQCLIDSMINAENTRTNGARQMAGSCSVTRYKLACPPDCDGRECTCGKETPELDSNIHVTDEAGQRRQVTFGTTAGGPILAMAVGCGGLKSTRIYALIKDKVAQCKRAGKDIRVLAISGQRVHAQDLAQQLEKATGESALYFENGNAVGCAQRLQNAPIAVCSMQCLRAFRKNKTLLKAYADPNTTVIILLDETATIARTLQLDQVNSQSCFPAKDESLDVFEKITRTALILAADADMQINSATTYLFNRIAPSRPVISVSATMPALQVEVEFAFAEPISFKGGDGDTGQRGETISERENSVECQNPGRARWFHTLHVAAANAARVLRNNLSNNRNAQDLCPDRLILYCDTVNQTLEMVETFKRWKLWSDEYCRRYTGGSLPSERAHFQNTKKHWAREGIAIVIVNTVVSVALTFDVRFGGVFCMTSRHGGLFVEQAQGLVRCWRYKDVFPLEGGWNDGRRVFYVLVDGAAPQTQRTLSIEEDLHAKSELWFRTLMTRNDQSSLEYMPQITQSERDVERLREKNIEAVQSVATMNPRTIRAIAENTAERDLNLVRHFDYVAHVCSLPTRGWTLCPIQDDGRAAPDVTMPHREGEDPMLDGQGGGGEDEEDDGGGISKLAQLISDGEKLLSKSNTTGLQKLQWVVHEYRGFFLHGGTNLTMQPDEFEQRFFKKSPDPERLDGDVTNVGIHTLQYNGAPLKHDRVKSALAEMQRIHRPFGHLVQPPPEEAEEEKKKKKPDDSVKFMIDHVDAIPNRATLMACAYNDIRKNVRPRSGFDKESLLSLASKLEGALQIVDLRIADFLPTERDRPTPCERGYGGQGFGIDERHFGPGSLVPFDSKVVPLENEFKWDKTTKQVVGKFAKLADAHEFNRPLRVEDGHFYFSEDRTESQQRFYELLKDIAMSSFNIKTTNGTGAPIPAVSLLSSIMDKFLAITLKQELQKQQWRVNMHSYKKDVLTGLSIVYHAKTITGLYLCFDRVTHDTLTPAVRFRRDRDGTLPEAAFGVAEDADDTPSQDAQAHIHPSVETAVTISHSVACHPDATAVAAAVALMEQPPYSLDRRRDISKVAKTTTRHDEAEHRAPTGLELDQLKVRLAMDYTTLAAIARLHRNNGLNAQWIEQAHRPERCVGSIRYTSTREAGISLSKCSRAARSIALGPNVIEIAIASPTHDTWRDTTATLMLDLLLDAHPQRCHRLRRMRNSPPEWLRAGMATALARIAIGYADAHPKADLYSKMDIACDERNLSTDERTEIQLSIKEAIDVRNDSFDEHKKEFAKNATAFMKRRLNAHTPGQTAEDIREAARMRAWWAMALARLSDFAMECGRGLERSMKVLMVVMNDGIDRDVHPVVFHVHPDPDIDAVECAQQVVDSLASTKKCTALDRCVDMAELKRVLDRYVRLSGEHDGPCDQSDALPQAAPPPEEPPPPRPRPPRAPGVYIEEESSDEEERPEEPPHTRRRGVMHSDDDSDNDDTVGKERKKRRIIADDDDDE